MKKYENNINLRCSQVPEAKRQKQQIEIKNKFNKIRQINIYGVCTE